MGDASTDRRRRFEAEAVAFMQPLYRTALHLTRNTDMSLSWIASVTGSRGA
ncbi:MAG: hypothetical protein L0099_01780 [Acidobacteria bacterium]|nr:hypothetical protein [Acidobacteriota bacterium]